MEESNPYLNILLPLILIVILIYLVISYILFPSYLSYVYACDNEKYLEKYAGDYNIGGSTIWGLKGANLSADTKNNKSLDLEDINWSEIQIVVELNNNSTKTLKHELVHVYQLTHDSFSVSCKQPIQRYLGEVQAYSSSYFPNFIFERIYGPIEH
jgi:hypothetical protein